MLSMNGQKRNLEHVKVEIAPTFEDVNVSSLRGPLSRKTINALSRADILMVSELAKTSDAALMRLDGFSRASLDEVRGLFRSLDGIDRRHVL